MKRTIDVLVSRGLITKIARRLLHGGKASDGNKFDGLVAKLQTIELDIESARKARFAAGKPGGLAANMDEGLAA